MKNLFFFFFNSTPVFVCFYLANFLALYKENNESKDEKKAYALPEIVVFSPFLSGCLLT